MPVFIGVERVQEWPRSQSAAMTRAYTTRKAVWEAPVSAPSPCFEFCLPVRFFLFVLRDEEPAQRPRRPTRLI